MSQPAVHLRALPATTENLGELYHAFLQASCLALSEPITDVSGDFFSVSRLSGYWTREDPTVSRRDYLLARANASQLGNSFGTHC